MTQLSEIETPIAGLYASSPEPLPFDPSLEIRAFLLPRASGNLLVYSVDGLAQQAPAIESLGGIARRYFNHRHEAMFASEAMAAPLFVHENERESVAQRIPVQASFSRRHTFDDDFEVIPIPGHTSGASAFLWDSGQHRFLFTGDTICLSDGEWVAVVLGSSDRGRYLQSLELLRELNFDVLVPWAATAGQPYCAMTSQADIKRRIDPILERVRRGEDR
jgi:hypothetical protein